ncbi:ectonucleotide pyrophosphatase phosphodiesterase family member 5 [Brachionus plicatilis]|uniref:Ectonucleotide pyrophosphatase phosphodiesterase family member 5 n=1 Tax=Brachionus plicatilis TaxID=10195 RepID=A0A3M7P2R4_BRAPC|nr:ectonucleotide pyrophosphatase phosphodiesterase family member 5 [Brachionus plicatilis]
MIKREPVHFLVCLLFFEFAVISCFQNQPNPLLLLISFDGFRWDYLSRGHLPNFEYLKTAGSYANYVKNTFSTVTFPNHWSIVTGLYQESHGILNNHIFDPELNKTFHTNKESMNTLWYDPFNIAEPIWTLNEKKGNNRLSAAEWLGSNIIFNKTSVTSVDYNTSRTYNDIIDQFIKFFTDAKRPINFGAVYFDEPDATGHKYGPDSKELLEKLNELDSNLGYLIDKLKSNKLFDSLNIIITSDHGMQSVQENNNICLEKHVDLNLFDVYGGVVSKNLFLKNYSDMTNVYQKLKNISNLDVYNKSEFPEKYHYKKNNRFGDILIVAKLGYIIYEKCTDLSASTLKGAHGYYNNESSMFPIFLAKGPAIRKNYRIENFDIVDIYPFMCAILDLEPGINNGSISNVESMLKKFSRRHLILYAFISLTPIATAILTAFFLFFINKRSNLPGQTTNAYDGYKILSTSETNSLANNDELADNAEL